MRNLLDNVSGIEERDDRSIFDDFREFEEDYVGKKSTKSFKKLWQQYSQERECMLGHQGIFRYGVPVVLSRAGSLRSPKFVCRDTILW